MKLLLDTHVLLKILSTVSLLLRLKGEEWKLLLAIANSPHTR